MHPASKVSTPPYLKSDYGDLPEIAIKVADVPMMPTTEWAIANNEWKNIVQAYLACVSFVDAQAGKVLRALEASPHADNTIVILWSDHGYHIGEKNRFAKHSLWERATRAPLMIAGPGLPEGRVCDQPAEMLDIYPTLADLCGLPANPRNEGHSLRPLLEDPEAGWPHAAITTYGRNNHAIRTRHFRYIRYENGDEELYDHRLDGNEWNNLAADPAYRDEIALLRQHLPRTNAAWSPEAPYDYNQYLSEAFRREVAR